jgi:hypothetical protein
MRTYIKDGYFEAPDPGLPRATPYASHGIHPFAAKCPPQLCYWASRTTRFIPLVRPVLPSMTSRKAGA